MCADIGCVLRPSSQCNLQTQGQFILYFSVRSNEYHEPVPLSLILKYPVAN